MANDLPIMQNFLAKYSERLEAYKELMMDESYIFLMDHEGCSGLYTKSYILIIIIIAYHQKNIETTLHILDPFFWAVFL